MGILVGGLYKLSMLTSIYQVKRRLASEEKTPEITICDEIDIKLFNEAEQNTFYNALLSFYKGFISTQCAQTMELEMYVG